LDLVKKEISQPVGEIAVTPTKPVAARNVQRQIREPEKIEWQRNRKIGQSRGFGI